MAEDRLMELFRQKQREKAASTSDGESASITTRSSASNSTSDSPLMAEVISSAPAFKDAPGTPEPVKCPYCGAVRYTKGVMVGGTVMWRPFPMRCCCPEAVKEHEAERRAEANREQAEKKQAEQTEARDRIRRLIGESGMNRRFLGRTFDTLVVNDENRGAIETAKRFAADFGSSESDRNSLLLVGPPGTGKTHLAAAVANSLLNRGVGVICMTMIDLLARIKKSYNRSGEDESDILELYKTAPLLIIDDLGKELQSEWAVKTVYDIIDGRYNACLPVIITSNYSPKNLLRRMTSDRSGDDMTAAAIVDRLAEMCVTVQLTCKSWRLRA